MTSFLCVKVKRLMWKSEWYQRYIDLFKTLFLTAIVCIDNKKIYREWYMGIQHLVKDNGYDLLCMLQ